MAPLSPLEKLEQKRNTIEINIASMETKLKDHLTSPLTLPTVLKSLSTAEGIEIKLADNYELFINTVTGVADLVPHTQVYTKLYDRILAVLCELEEIKAEHIDKATAAAAATAAASAVTTPTSHSAPELRLPRLTLPSFTGSLQEWTSFRDIFVSTVHNNATLSKVQKLTYLKSTLSGEAARLLQSIQLTDASYDIAWSQLTDRYQNDRELLFHILKRFFQQQNVQTNSASSLRSLIDVSKECIRSLEALKRPVEYWDDILMFQMFQRLDQASRELWEQSLKDVALPPLSDLMEFLEARARALAAGGGSVNTFRPQGPRHDGGAVRKISHVHHVNANSACAVCSNGQHLLFKCLKFVEMTVPQRLELVKKNRLCFNCLRSGHSISSCNSNRTCMKCQRKHNTLIHQDIVKPTGDNTATVSTSNQTFHTTGESSIPQTMLATSLVSIQDRYSQQQLIRALQDGCSNSSFITEACYRRLGLSKRRVDIGITGVGGVSLGKTKGITRAIISPHFNTKEEIVVQLLIVPTITGLMPEQWCDTSRWSHLKGLQLADPNFQEPASVDILLGADVFWNHLKDGRRYGPQDAPVAVNSTFGWLVAGKLNSKYYHISAHLTDVELDEKIQKFWEVESAPMSRTYTKEERQCEEHFKQFHSRDDSGRFVVQLPFKDNKPTLGSSREIATRRLQQLERRLEQLPERKQQYCKFMKEYIDLGHMELIPKSQINKPQPTCYIPHHFVLKESSSTTKFRVVFDASAKTSTGVSLNDCLMIGPKLQLLLVEILTNFRIHPVAFTADLEKMFRQIKVSAADSEMQRILWRDSPDQPIQEYRLLTVTYGTASAPYLATKTLQQLATDGKDAFPLAIQSVLNNMYVDDLMGGAPDKEQAKVLLQQLLDITKGGGLQFRKWSSNCPALLADLPPDLREESTVLEIDSDQTVKALGVYWNTTRDHFQFKLTINKSSRDFTNTKRILLSEIAKLFDPLGWLAPVIIRAKILLQELWKQQRGWDEILPHEIQQQWYDFRDNLHKIELCTINRCMWPSGYQTANLVGFCDASEKAYAAVVYLVVYRDDKEPAVSLISSKTRVAPSKQVTLPRLELCGSLLLAKLLTNIQQSLQVKINNIIAYTDSTIVLDWLRGHPSQWETFVANRVTLIQELVPVESWRHVSGIQNPADCASRGIDPYELPDHPLWWKGPSWLKAKVLPEPTIIPQDHSTADLEIRKPKTIVHHVRYDTSVMNNFSSMSKLVRFTSWIRRFIHNCQVKVQIRKFQYPVNQQISGPIKTQEIRQSELALIRVIQQQEFHEEISCLQKRQPLPAKSCILSLNPILDASQVLRVGGRLRHAPIPEVQKNPILLPKHHQFTRLLIDSEHKRQLHGGAQLLLSILTQKYWIVGAKDAIKHIVKKCVTCVRHGAAMQKQMMGDLPKARVTPTRPFQSCGVDFAGPFLLRAIPSRSKVTYKAYLAVFVCFSTRAIHLEVVTALSTDAFLAAFRRFIARRGRPNDIHSDCGTNFVGAAAEMKEFKTFISNSTTNMKLAKELSSDHIQWHFNPAGAPHMGGLWEAGVKSAKFHLHRIVGSHRLTYEELTTTVAQIEACLNSRPLTPVSTDPNDLTALTPGHFLIGAPMTAMPEPDLTELKEGRLSRWQLVQKLTQHFWTRWSNEFVSRMQQRPKWQQQSNNIKLNSLVIIKDDRLPPLKWKLGRVTKLHPGADGLVRVVHLKTADSDIDIERPIVKICLLPIDPECEV